MGKSKSGAPPFATPPSTVPQPFVYIFMSTVEIPMNTHRSLRGDSLDHLTQRTVAFVDIFMGIFVCILMSISRALSWENLSLLLFPHDKNTKAGS